MPSSKVDDWSSSSEDGGDDDFDDFELDEQDSAEFHSICDPTRSFSDLRSALEFDESNFGFDLLSNLSTDPSIFFEESIVLINKCRQFVADSTACSQREELGRSLNEHIRSTQTRSEEDDSYFKPVLQDDQMLMCIDELQAIKLDGGDGGEANDELDRLKGQVEALEEQLSRAKSLISSITATDDDGDAKKRKVDNDTYYFSSYSNTGIHEVMLRDTVRTAAYENAILSNSETLFRDKTVIDIGCGTGVLSMFCAKAGAKKVIAIDNSDVIAQAREIIKLNNYDDVITCVKGKAEALIGNNELPLDDGETVDVIISEWMGYGLFFETMLPSVMTVRDKLMADGGTMYPNKSRIYIEGANRKDRLDYWDDVHSFNMDPMKERMVAELTQEAGVEIVDDANISTDRAMLIEHDLNTCADQELDFEAPFELRLRGDLAQEEIHQLVVSFDIDFSAPNSNEVTFSTGCQSTPTHWKQTLLWFDVLHNCPVLGKSDSLKGVFRMRRNTLNHRAIDMAVSWGVLDENGSQKANGMMKRCLIA